MSPYCPRGERSTERHCVFNPLILIPPPPPTPLAAGFDPVSVGRQCLPGCDSGLQMIRSREICHHPIRLTIDVFKRVLVAVRATYLRTGFLLDVFKVRKDRVTYELFQICDLKMDGKRLGPRMANSV